MRQDKPRGRLAVLSLFVVLASAWCMDLAVADAAVKPRWASLGDLALSIELLTKDGTISAKEPLLARIHLTNLSDDDIRLATGTLSEPATYMEIRDSAGELVAATRRRDFSAGGICGVRRMGPGEMCSEYWVVTGWYQFDRPGKYTVQVQFLQYRPGLPVPVGDVLAEDVASVLVVSFDAARLKARCDELFEPIRMRSMTTDCGSLPFGVRRQALCSVRHDMALPYLEWMAESERYNDTAICRAVLRVGTQEAQKLYRTFAARNDKLGEEARHALASSLKRDMWDVYAH